MSIDGLVEIRCGGCGRSLGRHIYQGFATVSHCIYCDKDGFKPPPQWDPIEVHTRDWGTTTDDITGGQDGRFNLTERVKEVQKAVTKGRRKWMSRPKDSDDET